VSFTVSSSINDSDDMFAPYTISSKEVKKCRRVCLLHTETCPLRLFSMEN